MTSFFADFVHTENGVTCSESGLMDLSTAQECSSAVSYAKSFNSKAYYYSEVALRARPKGCYIRSGAMYFNSYSTGEGSSSETSICWKNISNYECIIDNNVFQNL